MRFLTPQSVTTSSVAGFLSISEMNLLDKPDTMKRKLLQCPLASRGPMQSSGPWEPHQGSSGDKPLVRSWPTCTKRPVSSLPAKGAAASSTVPRGTRVLERWRSSAVLERPPQENSTGTILLGPREVKRSKRERVQGWPMRRSRVLPGSSPWARGSFQAGLSSVLTASDLQLPGDGFLLQRIKAASAERNDGRSKTIPSDESRVPLPPIWFPSASEAELMRATRVDPEGYFGPGVVLGPAACANSLNTKRSGFPPTTAAHTLITLSQHTGRTAASVASHSCERRRWPVLPSPSRHRALALSALAPGGGGAALTPLPGHVSLIRLARAERPGEEPMHSGGARGKESCV